MHSDQFGSPRTCTAKKNTAESKRQREKKWLGLVYATADEVVAYMFYRCFFLFFMQPPSGRRRMRICFADVFLFFCFFPSTKNMRQPFSGTAERIFMKLLPNDRGENVV